ncbi:MAG: hypothetical protein HY043_24115, partial [Verrucomicrobia bacterium]|nr:hypothetical protein [Verrucomicrobiota bacterium]
MRRVILVAGAVFIAVAPPCLSAAAYLAPSTQRMAERLKKIEEDADPLQNPFLNHRAAAIFERQLQQLLQQPVTTNTSARLVGMRYKLAYELLNA